jgi:hypothetical protein
MEITDFGKGQVLAIGDINLVTTQYVQTADNQVFVRNLAKFLTDAARQKTLAEFPFLFNSDVSVQSTGDIKVDGELLSAISNLQKTLVLKPKAISFAEETANNSDRIVLTTFTSNKDNKSILESLKIDLEPKATLADETSEPEISTPQPETTPTSLFPSDELGSDDPILPDEISDQNSEEILLPGIGRVATSGLGVIGLVNEKDHLTLVIMASSPEKIQELINQMSSENLTNCLVQDDIAACRISGSDIEPVG